MDFIEWDPLGRAALFGGIFLTAVILICFHWYDTLDRPGRWTWRSIWLVLAVATLPAVVLGAANLDTERETLLNVFAWTSIAAGWLVVGSLAGYWMWGRQSALDSGGGQGLTIPEPVPFPDPIPEPIPEPRPQRPVRADAYLVVKAGAGRGRQYPVAQTVIIARRNGDVPLDDERVSNPHGQIKQAGGNYTFTDLGSTNGSFLLVAGREEPISRPQTLMHGDQLRVGRTVLEFLVTGRDGR